MKPECHNCGSPLKRMILNGRYAWACARECGNPIETGVAESADIQPFVAEGLNQGELATPIFTRPVPEVARAGVQVYMPQILYHFIECSWGACYNSIFQNALVPLLESESVVDFVLRTDVIRTYKGNVFDGVNGAKIYSELFGYLSRVESLEIRNYLRKNFPNLEPRLSWDS